MMLIKVLVIRRPPRDEAYQLLCKYNDSPALLTHGLTVEGVMRHFARLLGEDEEKWGAVGLMHDIDYQQFPEQHCHKAREILQAVSYTHLRAHETVLDLVC